jgi:elongation factor G
MSESRTHQRPIICVAIRPKTDDDRHGLQRALSELAQQDPTIRIETESPGGSTTICGMSELHLEAICHRIVCEYEVQIEIGKPKVIYLETIRKQSEAEGKYVRAVSGHCVYGHVKLRLEPLEPGSDYQFVDESSEGTVPQKFLEAINSGIQQGMKGGVLAGCEMVGVRAIFYDGSYHVEDSNETAFKIAASMAFKEAARKANPVILEPFMLIEVVTPEDLAGVIVGDLSFRRGRIEGMEARAGSLVISAFVPLAELIGYATHMRSETKGRASCSINFVCYEELRHVGDSGAEEAGVVANRPKGPTVGRGHAAAKPDSESE